MAIQNYRLGCPIWSNRDWIGEFFTADARPTDFLRQYASVFNAVEGNTTFYGLPSPETVARWREETPQGFRFCFKFLRSISHELRLHHADAETSTFLERLTPLAERLGPLFLQLPPDFGPGELDSLRGYLNGLPAGFEYAVEVRHPEFFAKGDSEKALNYLLHEHNIDRVILDSRALFSALPDDPDTREAQRKKPRLSVRAVAVGGRPLVRFIGHPEIEANRPFLMPWVEKVARWIGEGRTPFVFTHTPNNRYAPELARLFHKLLRERLANVGELPAWPSAEVNGAQQLGLF